MVYGGWNHFKLLMIHKLLTIYHKPIKYKASRNIQ